MAPELAVNDVLRCTWVVPPKLAAGLVMEGAIIASKLDPDLVDRGRWTLAPGPRGLQIARDDRRRQVA